LPSIEAEVWRFTTTDDDESSTRVEDMEILATIKTAYHERKRCNSSREYFILIFFCAGGETFG